jgi:hypothetical protein
MRKLVLAAATLVALAVPAFAMADTTGVINFGSGYQLGNINGQNGWSNTGSYDATIVPTSIPGLGSQSLEISNAVTSGSFGDQTLSPGLHNPVNATGSYHTFDGSFSLYASGNNQNSLTMSVSPDNGVSQPGFGPGGRMSYLRFENQPDGVHVYFDGVSSSALVNGHVNFNETQIATLSYGQVHQVRFLMTLKKSPDDRVKIFLDGKVVENGMTWEKYYESDPEAAAWQSAGVTPNVDALMFREAGTANPSNAGNGYLINNVSLTSS